MARTHAAYHSGDDVRSPPSPGRLLDVGRRYDSECASKAIHEKIAGDRMNFDW